MNKNLIKAASFTFLSINLAYVFISSSKVVENELIEKDSTDFSYNYSISVDLAAFILRFVSFINIDFNVLPLISMDANIML